MSDIRGITNLPWVISEDESEGPAAAVPGGRVFRAIAGGNLNIGDAVFLSANNTVNKSTTVGDHDQVCGIVVGGERAGRAILQRVVDVGLQVAAATEDVYVCFSGVCYVVSGAALTIGQLLKPDTGTAGRVIAATLGTGADQGKILGHNLVTAAGAAEKLLALISLS